MRGLGFICAERAGKVLFDLGLSVNLFVFQMFLQHCSNARMMSIASLLEWDDPRETPLPSAHCSSKTQALIRNLPHLALTF